MFGITCPSNYKGKFEVIVVDNASTDNTSSVAQAFARKLDLQILKADKKGRGAARKKGFDAAKGEFIFSIDADGIAPSNWIETILSYFDNYSVAAVTGTLAVVDWSSYQNWFISTGQPLTMRGYRLLFGHYWLTGSNFAIRKSIYQKAGGFNPQLTAHEDTDLAFRVRKLGKIQFVSRTPVITSSRRFKKKGSLRGLASYMPSFFAYRLTKNVHRAYLEDVR